MSQYELTVGSYQGPLQKLLELIEERKLEVTTVSLAKVTEDFLEYVRRLEKVEASLLADFIVIASRLLYLKSKALLPDFTASTEEEVALQDLEVRLKLYKQFRPAMKHVQRLWLSHTKLIARTYLMGAFSMLGNNEKIFYPGMGLALDALPRSLEAIVSLFERLHHETELISRRLVTLEEAMEDIITRLSNASEMSFLSLSHKRTTSEVVGIFLAILHLAREQHIFLEQGGHFSDIMIRNLRGAKDDENTPAGRYE